MRAVQGLGRRGALADRMYAGGAPVGLPYHWITRKGETMRAQGGAISQTEVIVQAEKAQLDGNLARPEGANALVLFAHGSGSSRHSPRNRSVAAALNEAGLATLLFDLLPTRVKAPKICVRTVVTARPEETIHTAAKCMAHYSVGTLVVVEERRPVGIITDRDLVVRVLAQEKSPARLTQSSSWTATSICSGSG